MAMSLMTKRVQQDPTVTAGAYSAGDAVGGLLTFADVTGNGADSQQGSVLESLVLVDEASQDVVLDLVLFTATFTATADNAAAAFSDAVLLTSIGHVRISDYATFAANSIATVTGIGLLLPATADGSIYGQLVTRGAPTYAATTDVAITISVARG